MCLKATVKIEMFGKPGLKEHVPGIAADRHIFSRFETMVLVEPEEVRKFPKRAPVDDGLAVVFAERFEIPELEQTIGGGEESDIPGSSHQIPVLDTDGTVGDQSRIFKAAGSGDLEKIVPVQRSA